MRIFIAGGTGVLGRRIVGALLDQGHAVTVLARSPERAAVLKARGATIMVGDALDRDAVEQAVTAARPEMIMHQLTDLAAGSRETNANLRINGTRNLVDAAQHAGVARFILQSIAWCYQPGDLPADENVALDTVTSDLGRRASVDAVICMEDCAERLPHTVVLRNGMLYGPDTWFAPDGAMAAAAAARNLPADQDITSFVHIDDAAAAAVSAIDWPAGAVNIVDDDPASAQEWAPAFCAIVGAPQPETVTAPRHPWARGALNQRARTLGWTPRFASWRTGMHDGVTT